MLDLFLAILSLSSSSQSALFRLATRNPKSKPAAIEEEVPHNGDAAKQGLLEQVQDSKVSLKGKKHRQKSVKDPFLSSSSIPRSNLQYPSNIISHCKSQLLYYNTVVVQHSPTSTYPVSTFSWSAWFRRNTGSSLPQDRVHQIRSRPSPPEGCLPRPLGTLVLAPRLHGALHVVDELPPNERLPWASMSGERSLLHLLPGYSCEDYIHYVMVVSSD